jgi:hypothetical protein
LDESEHSQSVLTGSDQYGNSTLGKNNASAIIKVGIAIGPDVWWGDL